MLNAIKDFFRFRIIILFVLIAPINKTFSQTEVNPIDSTQSVIITMEDGDEFRGKILKRDSKNIVLKTVNGNLNLIASKVKEIEEDFYQGLFRFTNPHGTHYFVGISAIPLKKGEGYYQNILVTTNLFNYGLTENISIGGGLEFLSTLRGTPTWFLTPKAGFEVSKNIHLGAGFFIAGLASEETASVGYGIITLGNPESNLSIGVGYGSINSQPQRNPALVISGTHRVSNGIAILSENYTLQDNSYFGIHGIRILSRKSSFDLGVMVIPVVRADATALPYIGFVKLF